MSTSSDWQLRLGQHIEGKRRLEHEQDIPLATEKEIESTRRLMKGVDPVTVEHIIESMRGGTKGEKLNNAGYAFVLPEKPFDTIARPGYEAQNRELSALMQENQDSTDDRFDKA